MALTIMRMPLQLEVAKKHAAGVPSKRRYDRVAAMEYARAFWNRHCSDGYVAVNEKKKPPYREVEPGRFFLDFGQGDREKTVDTEGTEVAHSILDDCSHFVSCCIGRPFDALRNRAEQERNPSLKTQDAFRLPAGGVNVRSNEQHGNPWLYGIVGAPAIVRFLSDPRIGRVFATKVEGTDPKLREAVKRLQPGDVIAEVANIEYSHILLYDGNDHVIAHTRCRDGNRDSHWLINTMSRYTCIHINDELAD